jgi:hypothetical protein
MVVYAYLALYCNAVKHLFGEANFELGCQKQVIMAVGQT